MKKIGLLLAALAVVVCAVSAQAALISVYSFDEGTGTTAANGVTGQAAGTMTAGAGWTTGFIGTGAYSTSAAGHSCVNILGNTIFDYTPWTNNSTGFWEGTWSMWMKTPPAQESDTLLWNVKYSGVDVPVGGDRFGRLQNDFENGYILLHDDMHGPGNGSYYMWRRTSGSAPTGRWGDGTTNTPELVGLQDGDWHLLTMRYQLTTGDPLSGELRMYLDGEQQAVLGAGGTLTENGVTSDLIMGAASAKVLFAGDNGNGTYDSTRGLYDDAANWNERLSNDDIRALNTLGRDTLNYGAKDANKLFELYYGADPNATISIGDVDWKYTASGLGSSGGLFADYAGSRGVNLGGSTGAGVYIVPVGGDVVWTGGTSSDYHTTSNWNPASTPNGVLNTFDDSATGTTTVNITGTDALPSAVVFNNASKTYTVTGDKGIAGAATVTKNGTGTVTLGSANTYTGLTTLNQGTLILKDRAKGMKPVMENAGIQMATKISVGGGNNKLVLDYSNETTSPAAEVKSLLTTSYDAANPTTHFAGTGKFASSIAGVANSPYAIGWKDDTVAKAITIGVTRYGDATMDGIANFDDLGKVLARYNLAGTWSDGDFTYDGIVNFDDLGKLLANYNQSVGAAASATPEPTSLILLATLAAMAGGWFIRRRVA